MYCSKKFLIISLFTLVPIANILGKAPTPQQITNQKQNTPTLLPAASAPQEINNEQQNVPNGNIISTFLEQNRPINIYLIAQNDKNHYVVNQITAKMPQSGIINSHILSTIISSKDPRILSSNVFKIASHDSIRNGFENQFWKLDNNGYTILLPVKYSLAPNLGWDSIDSINNPTFQALYQNAKSTGIHYYLDAYKKNTENIRSLSGMMSHYGEDPRFSQDDPNPEN